MAKSELFFVFYGLPVMIVIYFKPLNNEKRLEITINSIHKLKKVLLKEGFLSQSTKMLFNQQDYKVQN